MSDDPLQTAFQFTLPKGYVDEEGTRHTEGRMRLATAGDEISPLNDPRVQQNESYLTVILLSRVVTDLGSLSTVDPSVVEDLFVADLEHLQAMYERVNDRGADAVETACPDCGERFDVAAADGTRVDTDPDGGIRPSAADERADTGRLASGSPADTTPGTGALVDTTAAGEPPTTTTSVEGGDSPGNRLE